MDLIRCPECETLHSVSRECPTCEYRKQTRRAADERHQENLDANERHHRERLDADEKRERARQRQQEVDEERWIAAQEHAEELAAESQAHAEHLAKKRRKHERSLAEQQRQELHHHSVKQSVFGKARDYLDIAIAQRAYDPNTALTALHSSIAQWPGYAWAWIELAELLRAHGQAATQEIERAFTSAMAEGVLKLAPKRVPVEFAQFVRGLPQGNRVDVEELLARQAWFFVRFAQLALPEQVRKLLGGSPAFYPMLEGMPAQTKDPDRDALFESGSLIKEVDRLACLFVAKRSREALERLVTYVTGSDEGRASISQGHILSPWGDDAFLFACCAETSSDDLAAVWMQTALSVRLVDPMPALREADSPLSTLIADIYSAMKQEPAQRAQVLRASIARYDTWVRARTWERALDSAFRARALVIEKLERDLVGRFIPLQNSLVELVRREEELRNSFVANGNTRRAEWAEAIGQARAEWKTTQLELIRSSPIVAEPIAPPQGGFSEAMFLAWRSRIDDLLLECGSLRAEYGDPELDRAALFRRQATMAESLKLTRSQIAKAIEEYEAAERQRLWREFTMAPPVSFSRWLVLGGLVCLGPAVLAYWGDPSGSPWILPSAGLAIPVVAMFLKWFKRRADREDFARDADEYVGKLRTRSAMVMATPTRDVADILALLGQNVQPEMAPTPPQTNLQWRATARTWHAAALVSAALAICAGLVAYDGFVRTRRARLDACGMCRPLTERIASCATTPPSGSAAQRRIDCERQVGRLCGDDFSRARDRASICLQLDCVRFNDCLGEVLREFSGRLTCEGGCR